jgi:hypothetical protein
LPYPDCLAGALIYRDLRQDGLLAVRHWILPADNFLLTLHSVSHPWFAAFGTSVLSLVMLSYGIFLAGVVLTGWIVYRMTEDRGRAALSVALLFAAPTNLMNANHSHPVGHNSTMVYVLLGCLVVMALLAAGRAHPGRLAALGVIVAASTFSDPWFDAVFTAPAALVLAGLAFWPGSRDAGTGRAAGLALVSVLVGLIAGQALYAIAARHGFVEPREALIGSIHALPGRLHALGGALPLLFNVDVREPHALLRWPFLGCSVGLAVLIARHAPAVWRRATPARRFVLAYAVLSVASAALAFLGTRYAEVGDLATARYLLNVYYLVFVVGAVVVGAATPLRGWHKLVVAAWLALFAAPGVSASWRTFEAHGFQHASFDTHRSIVANLRDAGLTHGLAPHVSGLIGANSLTYLGAEQVTIRPVEVLDGYLRASGVDVKRRWYDEDRWANFLIVHRADAPEFERAAMATFGPPTSIRRYGEYVAWIWDGDVLRFLTPLPPEP